MKYHRIVVQHVLTALHEIFAEGRYADKSIEYYLKRRKQWGARDRRFFAETVYDIVRNWRRLWSLAGFNDSRYLDPESMTEENLWKVWAAYLVTKGEKPPDWPETQNFNADNVQKISEKLTAPQKNSWTDEMWNYAEKQGTYQGKKVSFEELNKIAPVFLRANALKSSGKDLQAKLSNEGINADLIDEKNGILKLKERQNVFSSQSFKDGLFEVQDISSQMVAPFLDPQPGERIIDACAGAGGKTLHIASLMKNKGRVIALDIHEWKLEELQKRARRNGFSGIETKLVEGTKTIKRLFDTADRVLLDVPCSGSGVLRRNPDSKWKMSEANVCGLLEEQKEILKHYSGMVKPGGVLVYATCSFFVSENENQIEEFINNSGGEWTLVDQKRIFPGEHDGDGFYMAKLVRQKS